MARRGDDDGSERSKRGGRDELNDEAWEHEKSRDAGGS